MYVLSIPFYGTLCMVKTHYVCVLPTCVTSDSYNHTMAKQFEWTHQGKAKTAYTTDDRTPLCTSMMSDPTRSYALLPIERMIRYIR